MLRCFRLFQRMFRRHRSPLMVKEVNANCEVGSGVSELLEATSVSKPRFRLAAMLFLRQGGDREAARHGGYAGQVLYIDRGGSESTVDCGGRGEVSQHQSWSGASLIAVAGLDSVSIVVLLGGGF
ncbi:hypothetical protein ABKV19_007158 [Rosa sericea]